MNPETVSIQPAPINPDAAAVRPRNRRTRYHACMDARAAERRLKCLALRAEGLSLDEIGTRLGLSRSAVHDHIQQALALSRAAAAKMGAQILDQERAKLQAIVDRWLPVAVGPGRAKEAARAAEIVRRTSDRLRVLYGLPVPPEPPSAPVPAPRHVEPVAAQAETAADPEPTPDPQQDLQFRAFTDVSVAMARAGLLPTTSYDDAWDALDAWQPEKYQAPDMDVQTYLRENLGENWKRLVFLQNA